MHEVQAHLMQGRFEKGIQLLEAGKKKFGKQVLFAEASLNGQIGSIHFLRKEFDKARPFLEQSLKNHWNARAMLGVLLSKKKDYDGMDQTFEAATKRSPKQGLLWSVWAYLHWKAGHADKAIDILGRGKDILGDSDERLVTNLLNLQNRKKMKIYRLEVGQE